MQHVCPAPIFKFNRHSCCLRSIRHSNIALVKISPFVLLLQKCNKLYLLDLTQYYDANYGYSSVAFPQQAKSNCLYIYARIVGLLVVTAIGYWTCGAFHGKGFNPCSCPCCCCCCCTRCIGSCLAAVVDVLHICNIVLNSVALCNIKFCCRNAI